MRGNLLYLDKESGLHKLHPLTKLAFTLFLLVCAAALADLIWLLAAFVFLLVPLAWWGRVISPVLRSGLAVITPFVISLSLIQGFFTGGETELFSVGSFVFTLEGWLAGLTVAARILVALSGALLLTLSTRPDALMHALTQRGLPNGLAYIVLSSIQIFPRFQDRAQLILQAQQARGLETQTHFVRRLGLLVPLTGPLILSSIVDVEERAMALEARAFSRAGRKTSLLVLRDSLGQRLVRLALLTVGLGLVAMRVWYLLQ
ncbi:MAG: energy-coupling factor transporter transmembrane component T [Anaerolineales bacterium]